MLNKKFYKDDILLLDEIEKVLQESNNSSLANDVSLLKKRIENNVYSSADGLFHSVDKIREYELKMK